MKMIETQMWRVLLQEDSVVNSLTLTVAAKDMDQAIDGAISAAKEEFNEDYDRADCAMVERQEGSIFVPETWG